MKSGIFVVIPVDGPAGDAVATIQEWADPRMAKSSPPHITIVGSSGVGPMPLDTPIELIQERLGQIAATTPPLTLTFERPHRFVQTDIVVLPLDPHGPLRALHERIATSGLRFESPRFAFSPHCTISFYPTLTPEMERRLMAVRVNDPVVLDRLQVFYTPFPQPTRLILELALSGNTAG
jgi:2'-5' RNA ligase